MISFQKIEFWHARKFPLATPQSQILHLGEEVEEYKKAKTETERYFELADIVIVCISFRRFTTTRLLADDLLNFYYFSKDNGEKTIIERYIKEKINIINHRINMNLYCWNGVDYDRNRDGKKVL